MTDRMRPKLPQPLNWRQTRHSHRSRSGVSAALTFIDSTRRYRIEQLIGYGELPFVAAVHDRSPNRRSHCQPIGSYATMAESQAACQQHRQTPQGHGVQFTDADDALPRRF